jgi:HEAT repeat protein
MKPQTAFHIRIALSTLILLIGVTPSTSAKQSPEVHVDTVGPASNTVSDILRRHDIGLTEPALLRALKNPDAEVRWRAAMKLAEDKAADAIPAVRHALSAEKVPRARVNIAAALGLLGDPGGRDELKKLCADERFPAEFRLYAVRYMFDLHVEKDEDCLHAAEEIVQRVDPDYHTAGDRQMALSILPRFQSLASAESKMVFNLVLQRLEDSEPAVQMEASVALASLGNTAAIPYLEAAIAREQEEGTSSVFEFNLKKLQAQ